MFENGADSHSQMRGFIKLTEAFGDDFEDDEGVAVCEDVPSSDMCTDLLASLADLIDKLRSHAEDGVGDLPLGVELGMQRAADMVENVISEFQ